MDRRISFFVSDAEPTSDGWLVHGELGLGPPRVGEQFDIVFHQGAGLEDEAILRIVAAGPEYVRLVGERTVPLMPGDILLGEVNRWGGRGGSADL